MEPNTAGATPLQPDAALSTFLQPDTAVPTSPSNRQKRSLAVHEDLTPLSKEKRTKLMASRHEYDAGLIDTDEFKAEKASILNDINIKREIRRRQLVMACCYEGIVDLGYLQETQLPLIQSTIGLVQTMPYTPIQDMYSQCDLMHRVHVMYSQCACHIHSVHFM